MLTIRTTLLAVFFAVSIMSSILLVISTLNYMEFYRAIEQIEIEISDVTLFIEPDNVEVTLSFTIENPTRFAGLKLRDLSWSLHFYDDNNETVYITSATYSYFTQPLPVESHWHRNFEHKINLNPDKENAQQLLNAYEDQQDVKWKLSATAIVISFVGTLDVPMSTIFHNDN